MTHKSLLNQIRIPIRWEDLDAYNHVGNQRYFSYMTEARAQWLKIFKALTSECLYVLIDTRCTFKKPFLYPGEILLKQFLTNIGNSSFELSYSFELASEPGIIHAEGYAKMVCVDPQTNKAMRIPLQLHARLAKHFSPSND